MPLYKIKNKLKTIFNLVLNQIIYILYFKFNFNKNNFKLLIVKNDSIGDYIIFRNFIEVLKKSTDFKSYKLYILTNSKMQKIIFDLDGQYIDEVLIIPEIINSMDIKLKYYFKLKSYKFTYLIHPTSSPNSLIQEIIKYSGAKYKYGFRTDNFNMNIKDGKYFQKYYTKLYETKKTSIHEFDKQKDFFEQLLNNKINLLKPVIKSNATLNNLQILICPGAQAKFRIWKTENIRNLIIKLYNYNPNYNFIIAITINEQYLFNEIITDLNIYIDLKVGLSIIELCTLIKQSTLVITMDSSPAHIAVALNANAICISNGNHFNRFIPYPQHCNVNQFVVLPKNIINNTHLQSTLYYGSDIDINTITVENVFEACKTKLN